MTNFYDLGGMKGPLLQSRKGTVKMDLVVLYPREGSNSSNLVPLKRTEKETEEIIP
jgi:hypothetical protein